MNNLQNEIIEMGQDADRITTEAPHAPSRVSKLDIVLVSVGVFVCPLIVRAADLSGLQTVIFDLVK